MLAGGPQPGAGNDAAPRTRWTGSPVSALHHSLAASAGVSASHIGPSFSVHCVILFCTEFFWKKTFKQERKKNCKEQQQFLLWISWNNPGNLVYNFRCVWESVWLIMEKELFDLFLTKSNYLNWPLYLWKFFFLRSNRSCLIRHTLHFWLKVYLQQCKGHVLYFSSEKFHLGSRNGLKVLQCWGENPSTRFWICLKYWEGLRGELRFMFRNIFHLCFWSLALGLICKNKTGNRLLAEMPSTPEWLCSSGFKTFTLN